MLRTLLLLALGAPLSTFAQQVIASGGGHYTSPTNAMSVTIGEPIIATVSGPTNTLTQGFQQPWVDITIDVEDVFDGPMINVYPNPVRHILNIAMDDPSRADRYMLFDAAGKQVTDGRITSTLTELDMEHYASGGYILRVLSADQRDVKSFKISVTH